MDRVVVLRNAEEEKKRSRHVVEHVRGRVTVRLGTNEIVALTRRDD